MAGIKQQILRRKPAAVLLAEAGPHAGGLKRALRAFDLTLLGIGAIVGAGIFVLTGVAAAKYAGPAITLSFVVAGFASSAGALRVAQSAPRSPGSGGAESYCAA